MRGDGTGGSVDNRLDPDEALARVRARDFRRTTLSPRHRPVVRALAEAFFSCEVEFPQARFDAFVDEIDQAISPSSKTMRFGLVAMLEAVRLLPIFVVRRFAFFESLPLTERVRMLEAMEVSRFTVITLVFIAWKTVMTMVFFEDADGLAASGYPGPARHRYRRGLTIARGAENASPSPPEAASR